MAGWVFQNYLAEIEKDNEAIRLTGVTPYVVYRHGGLSGNHA